MDFEGFLEDLKDFEGLFKGLEGFLGTFWDEGIPDGF